MHTKQKISLIDGPAGQIEIAIDAPLTETYGVWGVICHPHPLYGGTMTNKVVTTLAKVFQHCGVHAVRFNFRGVGKSQGQFDHGKGELEDLLAVVHWIQQEHPQRELWLAGFSFGAYIAAKAAIEVKARKLIMVAPPVENFPMQQLPPIESEWILVQGDKDEIVSAAAVYAWAKTRKPAPHILSFSEGTHFFHGQLGLLRTKLEIVLGKK